MRAFIALPIAPEAQAEVERLQNRLGELPGVGWTTPPRLHITLAFFAVLAPGEAEIAEHVIETVTSAVPAPEIALAGVGSFPDPAHPRVLWCGVEDATGALTELAVQVAAELRSGGVPFDERPFAAHCTIGRIHRRWPPPVTERWRRLLAAEGGFGTLPWRADELCLYESRGEYVVRHRGRWS